MQRDRDGASSVAGQRQGARAAAGSTALASSCAASLWQPGLASIPGQPLNLFSKCATGSKSKTSSARREAPALGAPGFPRLPALAALPQPGCSHTLPWFSSSLPAGHGAQHPLEGGSPFPSAPAAPRLCAVPPPALPALPFPGEDSLPVEMALAHCPPFPLQREAAQRQGESQHSASPSPFLGYLICLPQQQPPRASSQLLPHASTSREAFQWMLNHFSARITLPATASPDQDPLLNRKAFFLGKTPCKHCLQAPALFRH